MSLAEALRTAAQAAGLIASATSGPLSGVARVVAAAAGIGADLAQSGLDTEGIVDRITAIRPHGAGEVDARTDTGIAGLPDGPLLRTIVVNGQDARVYGGTLTYDEVVRLSGKIDTGLTVTFSRGRGSVSEGSVAPGGQVRIKDGTVINVSDTGAA